MLARWFDLVASARTLAARHRRVYWLVVATLAAGAGWLVYIAERDAHAARDAWGERTVVLVAATRLEPGDRLDDVSIRRVEVPVALRPDVAVDDVPDDATAAGLIEIGEIITSTRLRGDTLAGDLGSDRAAVAVPHPEWAVPIVRGDRVDLIVWSDPGFDDAASGAIASGLVIQVLEESAVVAVDVDTAPEVLAAIQRGAAQLVLRER